MKYPKEIYSSVSPEQCLTSSISHCAIFYHVKLQSIGCPMSHEINFWYEILFRFNLHLSPIKLKYVQNQTMPYIICQNKHVSFQWAIDEQVWKICNDKGLTLHKASSLSQDGWLFGNYTWDICKRVQVWSVRKAIYLPVNKTYVLYPTH